MNQKKTNSSHNGQASHKSEIMMEDSLSSKTNPIGKQLNALNQQNIQVRRPSDLSVCSLKGGEANTSSRQITIQTAQINKNIPSDLEKKKLNLINEESSVKEQSLQLKSMQESLRKSHSNTSYQQEPLLESDSVPSEQKQLINKQPVFWDALYTTQDQEQKKCQQIPYKVIRDNSSNLILTRNYLKQYIIVGLELCQFIFYLYFLSFVLITVTTQDYTRLYTLPVQLSLLLVGISSFLLSYIKHKELHKIDLLNLSPFIPFFAYIIDQNQQVIQIQLIHLVMIIKLHNALSSIKLIMISYNLFSIYFILLKIIQLHFLQIALAFILFSFQYQEDHDPYQLLTHYTLINILTITEDNSLILYIVKTTVLVVVFYIIAEVQIQISSFIKNSIYINDSLIQLNQSINKLCLPQRLSQLEQQQSRLNELLSFNHFTPDHLNEEVRLEIIEEKYQNLIFHLPIFSSLSSFCQQKILGLIKEEIYSPNQIIVHPNSVDQSLYFLIQGEVQVFQESQHNSFELNTFSQFKVLNQVGFFLNQLPDVGIKSVGYSKIVYLPYNDFMTELIKHPQDLQRYRMKQDSIIFTKDYKSIDLRCYICDHHHFVNNCKFVHYRPNKKMLIDYINHDKTNSRKQFTRRKQKKINTRLFQHNTEFVAMNYKHLQDFSSDASNLLNKRPKTTTSIVQHYEDVEQDSREYLAQQVQNISPVSAIQQGSSMSSYPFPQKESTIKNNNDDLVSRQKVMYPENCQSYKKYVQDSFLLHQKRYREKRQSFSPMIERQEDLSGYQKYATVQDRNNSYILSSEQLPSPMHAYYDDKSKMQIQSSKFTGETSKQFMQSPLDMPFIPSSFESSHQYSDYFPQHNIDQALQSYRMFQDAVLSSQKLKDDVSSNNDQNSQSKN